MGKLYKTEALTNLIWKMEDEGITVRELADHFSKCLDPHTEAANFLNALNAIDIMCLAGDSELDGPLAFYPKWFEERDVDGLLHEVHYVHAYTNVGTVPALAIQIGGGPTARLLCDDLIVLKHVDSQPEADVSWMDGGISLLTKEFDDMMPVCPRCGFVGGRHSLTCDLFTR